MTAVVSRITILVTQDRGDVIAQGSCIFVILPFIYPYSDLSDVLIATLITQIPTGQHWYRKFKRDFLNDELLRLEAWTNGTAE